jgi:hypothetical protein
MKPARDRRSARRYADQFLLVFFALAAAFLAVSALAGAAAQENRQSPDKPADLKPFVGTWKAAFQGQVFAILKLKEERGDLVGTMNNFDVRFDPQGNLTDGTYAIIDLTNTAPADLPLINPHWKAGALIFLVSQKDSYAQPLMWKFVVKNSKEGELTELPNGQLYAPSNGPIKPIRMIRDNPRP